MNIFDAIILGLVQGLSEFLPISSSGHLVLAYYFLDVEGSLLLSVLLHVGTLFAVFVAYRKTLINLIKRPFNKVNKLIIFASIPTFILALLFKLLLPDVLNGSLLPIGFALSIVLIILSCLIKPKEMVELNTKNVLIIGAIQGLASVPGLSRSGSTISTAKLLGVSAPESVNFSFLLSIPIIFASGLLEGYEYATSPVANEISFWVILVGIFVAFLSGLLAINVVKRLAVNNKFILFAFYLLIPLIVSLIIM